MKNDCPIEGQIQGQEKIGETKGVQHPGLKSRKQRYSAFDKGVPERKMALVNGLHPNKTEGVEKGCKVSLDNEEVGSQNVTEIQEGETK
jgi:hypothetical protein